MKCYGSTVSTVDVPVFCLRNSANTCCCGGGAERSSCRHTRTARISRKIGSAKRCTTVAHDTCRLKLSAIPYRQAEVATTRPGSVAIHVATRRSACYAAPQPVKPTGRLTLIRRHNTRLPVEPAHNLPLIFQSNIARQIHCIHTHRTAPANRRQ